MADVKWIKIVTDVFDDEKLLLIETLPEADSIIVIWFKLLCLAGKQNNNGVFMMNDKIPYTEKMLATIFRRKESTVQLALQTFENFEMIEIINGVITIPNWSKHQNFDKIELAREQTRKRVAKHREKQKQKLLGTTPTKVCAYCGKEGANTIDHIIPINKGGLDIQDNLVECCTECNSSKCDRDLLDFLNNSWHISKVGADIEGILNNPKLNKYVDYNGERFVEKKCNVTDTLRNADRIDKSRIDKNRIEENNNNVELPSNNDNTHKNSENYITIIDYLNSKTGSKYKATTKSTRESINARLKEGFTVEDFKTVIDNQYTKWKGTEWEQYLRPQTLFGTKFESYLNAPPVVTKQHNNNEKLSGNPFFDLLREEGKMQ